MFILFMFCTAQAAISQAPEDLRRTLASLNDQLAQQERQYAETAMRNATKVSDDNKEITRLTEMLREHEVTEHYISSSANMALRQEALESQATREQIDENIRTGEQQVAQTSNVLNYWQSQPALTESPEQIETYQQQLAAQKAAVENLRNRRASVATAQTNSALVTSRAAQGSMVDLVNDDIAIRRRISALRDEIALIGDEHRQMDSATSDLKAQIQDTQKKLQASVTTTSR